jgi:hypothetical protein
MTATVTRLDEHRAALSARDKLQCLVLAQMNEEKADYCTEQQTALKAFFLMNAAMLRKVAGE